MARHTIEVLGRGCGACDLTERLVRETVAALGADATVIKVDDTAALIARGVLATPAIAVDAKIVHMGGLPRKAQIEAWIRDLDQTPGSNA